jgi:hypothetical protein
MNSKEGMEVGMSFSGCVGRPRGFRSEVDTEVVS